MTAVTEIVQERPPEVTVAVQPDYTVRWVAGIAAVVSTITLIWFSSRNEILLYWDSVPHLEIARRVVSSPTPGFGQLGSVWLPLPHLLSIPFVWIDALYYSGLAGSIVSMVAFVVTAVLLYKITFHLTGYKPAALVAGVVFIANPNVIYMQATPMTELLLFACMVGMVYGVQRWIQTDRPRYLLGGAVAGLLGALTRYEAWILLALLTAVVLYAGLRKKRGWSYAEGTTAAFFVIGIVGPLGWVLWNLLIFGDPLSFLNGKYSKPSLWVDANDPVIGHLWVSIKSYYYATLDNLSLPIVILTVAGMVAIVVKERLAPRTLPVLALLALFPFFVAALYGGQRPLHVLQLGEGLYNVRFGLLMVLPAAVMIGYLVSLLEARMQEIAAVFIAAPLVITLATNLAAPGQIITLQEPASVLNVELRVMSVQTSDYLRNQYDGGTILMQSFGNEFVLPDAHIGSANNVYEGSYKMWEPTLADPSGHNVRWIIMRKGGLAKQRDDVNDRLSGSPELQSYALVYQNEFYSVYKKVAQ
jgi:hypothetical protein